MAKYEVLNGFCISAGRDVYPGNVVELSDEEVLRISGAERRLRRVPDDTKLKAGSPDDKPKVAKPAPAPPKMKMVLDVDGKTKIEVPEDDPRPAVK